MASHSERPSENPTTNLMKKTELDTNIEANIPVWIQFILSGTIVATIQYLSQNVEYRWGSILYGLPYTFLILLTIYYINNFPRRRIRKFGLNVILSLATIATYAYSFGFLQKYTKYNVSTSLLLAFIPWFILTLVIYYEPHKPLVDKYII
jgi:cation transport ATPase